MPYETILCSASDGIARITLNRPERLNAINATLTAELMQAVGDANNDPSVSVIILSGAGRAFCAGYDLDWARRPRMPVREPPPASGMLSATTRECPATSAPSCPSGRARNRSSPRFTAGASAAALTWPSAPT